MNIRKWIENLEWYGGNSAAKNEVSASVIGGDLLPIWLAKKFPKDKSKMIGLNYQGSAFHRGMEEKLCSPEVYTESSGIKSLKNGWSVTGTADIVNVSNGSIHDYKTTSASGYKEMRKSAKNKHSRLAVQGAVLNWLHDMENKFFAEVFIRDFKPWRKDHPASAYQQLPVDIMNHEEIVEYLTAKTSELDGYIKRDEAPPECKDVMWMVYEGNRIKLKCEYYCDYKSNCPYYAKKTNHLAATKHKVGGW